jgi:hypothetical protein
MARSWTCLPCLQPWPCQTRRNQLLAQYAGAPGSLALLLGSAFVEAAADLPDVPAGELYEQFVGWLPPFPSG